jgi:lysophospholipase L1-like esterase
VTSPRLSLLIYTAVLLAVSYGAVAQVRVVANDTNIEYVGRWDRSNSSIYHSYWGGAYLRLYFIGTSAAFKELTAVDFWADIDGAGYKHFMGKAGAVNVASSLPDAAHVLTVVAAGEDAELQFQGFTLSSGATLLAPAIPNKPLIEFIGDSITCGARTPREEIQDYAWLTGERLKCDHTQIAYSGITLVDGYHYNYSGAPQRGQNYQYFVMQEPNSPVPNIGWTFANYIPRVVVINLGTNDGGLGVPSERFQINYVTFLQNIHARFPNATILALRPFYGYYATQIRCAVNQVYNAGDRSVRYIDTTGWISSSPCGTNYDTYDGWHPTVAGHQKIANILAPILRAYVCGESSQNQRNNL